MTTKGPSNDGQEASTEMLPEMVMMPNDAGSMEERYDKVEGSSGDGREDRESAVPLLGLTSPVTEKAGENSIRHEEAEASTCYAPLLGTISLSS